MSEYCLRWNNHRPNLVTVFSELLTSEALVDVTLATDGHYIHAHKLVLSACSVYFKVCQFLDLFLMWTLCEMISIFDTFVEKDLKLLICVQVELGGRGGVKETECILSWLTEII